MLPHIKNSKAGVNKQDPVYQNMFEVYFTIPAALQAQFGNDVAVLTEQVQSVEGLGTLDKGPDVTTQKFMGTTRTYLNSKMDTTSHELTVKIALNLRDGTDNYIYKLLKAWNNLGYNHDTGETTLKVGYTADWFKVVIANRAGDIYREILYKDIMMSGGFEAYNQLDYGNNDLVEASVKFVSDWADDKDA